MTSKSYKLKDKQERINVVYSDSYPSDYHTDEMESYYRGELRPDDGTYYNSQQIRKLYYHPNENENKHLCRGHAQGYKFCVQQYTKEEDWVFDPCVGSGTAIVEAMVHNRNGIGIELEYPNIAKMNVEHQKKLGSKASGIVFPGDMREVKTLLPYQLKGKIQLIVTGTPYNNNADAPERKNLQGEDSTFNYTDKKNIAFMKDDEYYQTIKDVYSDCIDYLKPNGYFAIIIKDTIRQKQPYLLHKHLSDTIRSIPGVMLESVFIHKHWPPTLFMNTYNKITKNDIQIPLYQTIVVFRKSG